MDSSLCPTGTSRVAEFYANFSYTDDCTLVLSVNGTYFELDELKLGEILEVPTDGMKTLSGKASDAFKNVIVKREGSATRARLFKKELKPEYQLLFVLVNKVVLPRAEGRSIASIADQVLLEALSTFTPISLSALMIEHIIKVINAREGRHGLSYGFLLTKAQEMSTAEIQRLKAENALLIVQLAEKAQEPGSHGELEAANAENEKLLAKNEKLRQKVDELRDEMLQDLRTSNERVDRLLKALALAP
ncbi:hypothetical protein RND71_042526 [Anisodus tanguticus]|uniref:Putative plant transposon protein domain-containing protein n=1 Tax=Anisodus tanguticus TaxID=243964 RepID=A0AAE1QQC9_9SOLA|nr:hypothetical protein RND71_042526 [Anisodus tanguticus]